MDNEYRVMCASLIFWIIILFVIMLLGGCARHTTNPVSDINNGIQDDVAQLVDYANNNMVMDADKQLLLKGAKDCAARADAMSQKCEVSITACEAKTTAVKAERNSLALILALLVVIKLFNIRI